MGGALKGWTRLKSLDLSNNSGLVGEMPAVSDFWSISGISNHGKHGDRSYASFAGALISDVHVAEFGAFCKALALVEVSTLELRNVGLGPECLGTLCSALRNSRCPLGRSLVRLQGSGQILALMFMVGQLYIMADDLNGRSRLHSGDVREFMSQESLFDFLFALKWIPWLTETLHQPNCLVRAY